MDTRNDSFRQVILDSVYSKGEVVGGQSSFYRKEGQKIALKIAAKKNEDNIIFTITDVTDLENARIQHKDSALIMALCVPFIFDKFFKYPAHKGEIFKKEEDSSKSIISRLCSGSDVTCQNG